MASFVIVWENNTFGHKKVAGHSWPGHACMNIGSRFHDDVNVDPPVNSYVSWFPLERAGEFNLKTFFKDTFKPKEGYEHRTLGQDCRFERYLPDHVIKLESTEEQENRMRAE